MGDLAAAAADGQRPGGTLDSSPAPGSLLGRIRRPRQGWKQALKETPLNYLFERSKVPGEILGVLLVSATVLGGIFGVQLGFMLFLNWGLSQGPCVAQTIRTAVINWRNGIKNPLRWDWSWWTRPQSHQPPTIVKGPERPLEMEFDAATFVNPKPTWYQRHAPRIGRVPRIGPFLIRRHPWLARKILLYEQKLIDRADLDKPGAVTWLARQTDDWLNQRARTPSFVIGMSELIATHFAGASLAATFVTNALVSWIPSTLAAFLAWQTGDLYRYTRPGIRQRDLRPKTRIASHAGLDRQAPELSSPSMPLPPQISSPSPSIQPSRTAPAVRPRLRPTAARVLSAARRAGHHRRVLPPAHRRMPERHLG